jgi:DNA-binding response OmpR family regulator/Tfp pilus assembly protein PilZ
VVFALDKQEQWLAQRQRLESRARVLVIEHKDKVREQLEEVLYQVHLQAEAVDSGEEALKLIQQGRFSLVVLPEGAPGLNGLTMARQLRAKFPDLDFVITSRTPSWELTERAYDDGIKGILRKPLTDPEEAGQQLMEAVLRNVDRRMRQYLLAQLRLMVEDLDDETHSTITSQLEQRLAIHKEQMGTGNMVLVQELTQAHRQFSETLFLAGFELEVFDDLEVGQSRLAEGGINLLVLEPRDGPQDLAELMAAVLDTDPLVQVLLMAEEPNLETAIAGLRHGAAYYVHITGAYPASMMDRLEALVISNRQDRLLENLVVEMFRCTQLVLTGASTTSDVDALRELMNLPPLPEQPPRLAGQQAGVTDSVVYLDSVLSNILSDDEPGGDTPASREEGSQPRGRSKLKARGRGRRSSTRLWLPQFVRYRPLDEPTHLLAYLGNLSQGGLFIRTDHLLFPGTEAEVDFNLEHDGQGFRICCQCRVVWVSDVDQGSEGQPRGIGVEFDDPPEEVVQLIGQVVGERTPSE